jgi:VanZ family protein
VTAARLVFGLTLLINLAAVYWPSEPVPGPQVVPHLDKLGHVVVFAALVFTGRLARFPVLPLVVLVAVHAVVSEVLQHVLYTRRSGDPWDVVADWVGIAVGAALPLRRRWGIIRA